jgi:hypothetical protein
VAARQKKNGPKGGKKRPGGLPEKFCFVLMPFRDPYDTYYERIYVPAIKAAGLEPRRINEVFRAGTIIKDIWEHTVSAQVLVAEVTGRNPNVFYELGLAHAIAKPVVLITQTLDDVPFDLKHLRHILYTTVDPDWAAKLQEDLTRAIVETLQDPVASLALPSVTSYTLAGGREPSEESEVITLLKAVDSKIDYMRRESVPALRLTADADLSSFLERELRLLPPSARRQVFDLIVDGVHLDRALEYVVRRRAPQPGTEATEARG